MTKAICGPEITTTNYLSHFILQQIVGPSHGTMMLHSLPADQCSHVGCSCPAPITSIKTSWLKILHIKNFMDESIDIEHTFTIPDGQGSSVAYQLVGHVVFCANHFVSEVMVGDQMYYYDDMDSGKLQEKTPASIVSMPSVLIVYHCITSQVCISYIVSSLLLIWCGNSHQHIPLNLLQMTLHTLMMI